MRNILLRSHMEQLIAESYLSLEVIPTTPRVSARDLPSRSGIPLKFNNLLYKYTSRP